MIKLSLSIVALVPLVSFGSTGGGSTSGGSTGGGSTGSGSTAGSSSTKLNDAAAAHGKYFGTETDGNSPELSETAFRNILDDKGYFSLITPGNSMKWDATEPSRGRFVYTNSDALANIAKQNGQRLRGHNCVWHSQLPSWVTNGNFDKSTLTSILQNHITNVVGHFKGQICKHYS
ncbi:hypothetical protein VKT23_010126 [Stygiomarasmius scandens]|uniref:GH10 domain-containing protein n=1 Tax=Marasmiellus scandens TaxID=2682957 RepID=A0ABR1JD38_9AGAR